MPVASLSTNPAHKLPAKRKMGRERLQLTVRSQRVTRLVEYEVPVMTTYGKLGVTRKRVAVHEYVLDERQKKTVEEARELAKRSGLVLEVKDISQRSPLRTAVGKLSWVRGRPEAVTIPDSDE